MIGQDGGNGGVHVVNRCAQSNVCGKIRALRRRGVETFYLHEHEVHEMITDLVLGQFKIIRNFFTALYEN